MIEFAIDDVWVSSAPEERVESGLIQFGDDDWPGLFIRGDDALFLVEALERATSVQEIDLPVDDLQLLHALSVVSTLRIALLATRIVR